jgi:hypothetical protein
MIGWSTGRFHINEEQLATATDRLLVCGVKKPRIGRGSSPVVEAPVSEPSVTETIAVPVLARPTAALGTFVFAVGIALGFGVVTTWPF